MESVSPQMGCMQWLRRIVFPNTSLDSLVLQPSSFCQRSHPWTPPTLFSFVNNEILRSRKAILVDSLRDKTLLTQPSDTILIRWRPATALAGRVSRANRSWGLVLSLTQCLQISRHKIFYLLDPILSSSSSSRSSQAR